jgi:hypothetical protein
MDTDLAAGEGAHSADDLDMDLVADRFHHDSIADSGAPAEPGEDFNFDQVASDEITLAEHLERQALQLRTADQPLALHLISLIDEAGYLTEPLAGIAERLGLDEAEVERVLRLVQTFDPTGVGARSLAECIALQAIEVDRYDPCMAALIANLELVARGDLAQLRRLCGVDAEDLADMLRELRSYNPKPGLLYGGGRTVPVVPDVFVRRGPRGGWSVELNSGTLPRLIVVDPEMLRVIWRPDDIGVVEAYVLHWMGLDPRGREMPMRQVIQREGTGWLWRMVHRIENGQGSLEDLDRLNEVAGNIQGRTICALGDAAAMPVRAFLKHFRDEFAHHITNKRCLVDDYV